VPPVSKGCAVVQSAGLPSTCNTRSPGNKGTSGPRTPATTSALSPLAPACRVTAPATASMVTGNTFALWCLPNTHPLVGCGVLEECCGVLECCLGELLVCLGLLAWCCGVEWPVLDVLRGGVALAEGFAVGGGCGGAALCCVRSGVGSVREWCLVLGCSACGVEGRSVARGGVRRDRLD